MNTLQIVLVEDDPSAALSVEMVLSEMGYPLTKVCYDGETAYNFIVSELPDLIIMDINLKNGPSGLEIAERIGHLKIPVIFTTAYRDREIYEAAKKNHFCGYLVKPFDALSLQSVIEQAFRHIHSGNNLDAKDNLLSDGIMVQDSILIKRQNLLYKVRVSDIVLIQGEGNYSTLILGGNKKFVVKISLKKLLDQLNESFLPVHKSYVVNLDKIDAIDPANGIIHAGSEKIPLGRNFKNLLLERFRLLK